MNKTISSILIFVAGAAVGSVTACMLVKERYKRYYAAIADEEIESVKAVYSKKAADEKKKTDAVVEEVKKHEQYHSIIRESGYEYDKEGEAATIEDDEPYVISPDEFGSTTNETIYLTYYADRILADDVDDIVDDIDGTVGRNSLLRFGEYEEEIVHVRNDTIDTDYEITLDTRNYWGDIKPLDERS